MARGIRGRAEVSHYLASLPAELTKVLRGAARASAAVIADEAKLRCRSTYVAERLTSEMHVEPDHMRVTVTVKRGFARSVATWLEFGTSPHFISVDDTVRSGRTASRINRNADAQFKGTLLINGKPVGATVYHKGADPYPFLRPALDVARGQAIAAAQSYLRSKIVGGAIASGDLEEGDTE